MWEDPIVNEIHKHRREMLDRFNGDFDALFDYLKQKQGKNGRKVITLPKKEPVLPNR